MAVSAVKMGITDRLPDAMAVKVRADELSQMLVTRLARKAKEVAENISATNLVMETALGIDTAKQVHQESETQLQTLRVQHVQAVMEWVENLIISLRGLRVIHSAAIEKAVQDVFERKRAMAEADAEAARRARGARRHRSVLKKAAVIAALSDSAQRARNIIPGTRSGAEATQQGAAAPTNGGAAVPDDGTTSSKASGPSSYSKRMMLARKGGRRASLQHRTPPALPDDLRKLLKSSGGGGGGGGGGGVDPAKDAPKPRGRRMSLMGVPKEGETQAAHSPGSHASSASPSRRQRQGRRSSHHSTASVDSAHSAALAAVAAHQALVNAATKQQQQQQQQQPEQQSSTSTSPSDDAQQGDSSNSGRPPPVDTAPVARANKDPSSQPVVVMGSSHAEDRMTMTPFLNSTAASSGGGGGGSSGRSRRSSMPDRPTPTSASSATLRGLSPKSSMYQRARLTVGNSPHPASSGGGDASGLRSTPSRANLRPTGSRWGRVQHHQYHHHSSRKHGDVEANVALGVMPGASVPSNVMIGDGGFETYIAMFKVARRLRSKAGIIRLSKAVPFKRSELLALQASFWRHWQAAPKPSDAQKLVPLPGEDVFTLQAFEAFMLDHYPGLAEVSSPAILALFRVFNTSGSGLMSFEELCRGLATLLRGSVARKAALIFQILDVHGLGAITEMDLLAFLRCPIATVCPDPKSRTGLASAATTTSFHYVGIAPSSPHAGHGSESELEPGMGGSDHDEGGGGEGQGGGGGKDGSSDSQHNKEDADPFTMPKSRVNNHAVELAFARQVCGACVLGWCCEAGRGSSLWCLWVEWSPELGRGLAVFTPNAVLPSATAVDHAVARGVRRALCRPRTS